MTIDERLERLTERHEALAQSMELFQHEAAARDAITDARFGRILDLLEQQAANIEKQAGNIDKLAAIAQDHQRRIDRLES